jgi:uncharacterized protein (TIGR02996 family)
MTSVPTAPMPTDGAMLLAAILADADGSADDDTRRLVYADWLDENGQGERAELIRVQVELERMRADDEADDPASGNRQAAWIDRRASLTRRELELLPDFERALRSHYAVRMAFGVARGFAEEVRCPAEDWLRHAGAVLRECPVRRVVITDRNPVKWLDSDMCYAYIPGINRDWEVDLLPHEEGESVACAVLRATWPGVRFQLPSHDAAGVA